MWVVGRFSLFCSMKTKNKAFIIIVWRDVKQKGRWHSLEKSRTGHDNIQSGPKTDVTNEMHGHGCIQEETSSTSVIQQGRSLNLNLTEYRWLFAIISPCALSRNN